MPIPWLIIGAAVAGIVGAAGHSNAKETNEEAQRIAKKAQGMYDDAKGSLDAAQKATEDSLLKLGYAKKKVLETSIHRFIVAYKRIKNIELAQSVGLNEINNFQIDSQSVLQLQKMSNIYGSAFSSGATGAATGAVVALAASGSLPVVTGTLSLAGTAVTLGEFGIAAGLTGSALSLASTVTPLAAIAAPVVLFTGISSSIKADENLEKAETMYAEAEEAVEKMKTAEVLCNAIVARTEMFYNLLGELDMMFARTTVLLDEMTSRKQGFLRLKTVDASTFSKEELQLVAVTRALAGAIKAVVDTPILTGDGEVSSESLNLYEQTRERLPSFSMAVNDVVSKKYTNEYPRSYNQTIANGVSAGQDKKKLYLLIIICGIGMVAISFFILLVLFVFAIFLSGDESQENAIADDALQNSVIVSDEYDGGIPPSSYVDIYGGY